MRLFGFLFAVAARHPDVALVQRALAGKRASHRMLARRLLPVICAHVRRTLRRRGVMAEGDDLVQEVWLTLMKDEGRQLAAFDPGRASLEHYVGLITRREVGNHLDRRFAARRGGGQVPASMDEAAPVADGQASPERAAVDRDLAARLDAHLLATLPTRGQLVYRLLFTDGYGVDEAAAALQVQRQVIYNWRHKIRLAAKAFVAEQG